MEGWESGGGGGGGKEQRWLGRNVITESGCGTEGLQTELTAASGPAGSMVRAATSCLSRQLLLPLPV